MRVQNDWQITHSPNRKSGSKVRPARGPPCLADEGLAVLQALCVVHSQHTEFQCFPVVALSHREKQTQWQMFHKLQRQDQPYDLYILFSLKATQVGCHSHGDVSEYSSSFKLLMKHHSL